FNMMTASWGAFGILWNKPIALVFIRHNRYTLKFMEENQLFSLSFFPERYRETLKFYGTKSGRELNKMKATGLNPIFTEDNGIYYEEANLVFVCKKLYFSDINEEIPTDIIKKYYTDNIFHRMFIGEIGTCLQKMGDI
ncbi:MAG: flavin reductase family protein, partial [Proteobacteria bacterium]|nr:flavin reductase family protein [Pseudomonadota bacterium]